MNHLLCNCKTSPFTDPSYGHLVTGDIRIIQNNKLGNCYVKVPNTWNQSPLSFETAKLK